MSNQVNYKQKYEELKMKFMESVDAAFRMGFEQGAVQAQQDQMMQQQQAAQEAAAGQQPGEGGGAEGSQPGAEQMANPNGGDIGDMEPDSENPAGSELDQHIAKLESMVSKSELSGDDLKKAVAELSSLRKSMAAAAVTAREMKKSDMAIKGISKALHKPAFKIGAQANHNMSSNAKAAVGMQEKIVNDIMKSWADEEKNAANSISKVLGVEGLIKSEKK